MSDNKPTIFKELPKEQQKALRKEFAKSTKADRNLIIVSIVIGVVIIACSVIALLSDHRIFSGTIFPIWIFPVMIAINEDKFTKWLKAEKDIIMKKKKNKS